MNDKGVFNAPRHVRNPKPSAPAKTALIKGVRLTRLLLLLQSHRVWWCTAHLHGYVYKHIGKTHLRSLQRDLQVLASLPEKPLEVMNDGRRTYYKAMSTTRRK